MRYKILPMNNEHIVIEDSKNITMETKIYFKGTETDCRIWIHSQQPHPHPQPKYKVVPHAVKNEVYYFAILNGNKLCIVGTIDQCEAYIRLSEKGFIEND